MKRTALTAVVVAAGAVLTGALTLAAPAVARSGTAPAALQPPEGQRLVLSTVGRGVQIYDCTNGAWTFRAPAAAILEGRRTVAIHSAGPSWQSIDDGSRVVGRLRASEPARRPDRNIPWLLLEAASTSGPGVFGEVDFIQRLDTRGGVGPSGPCDPAGEASVSVPYRSTYNFWAAPNEGVADEG